MSVDPAALNTAQLFCQNLQTLLKENLAGFALYGSAVRGEMIPGRSDINVVIVLEHSSPEAHRAVAEQLRRFPQIAPFMLSRWELPRSLRVFALKFLSIARNYKVLFGLDPLADFSPPEGLLLFLCEQSLRNLRLRLKHSYICNALDPQKYTRELMRYAPSLLVTLSEVLRCTHVEVPIDFKRRPEIIEQAFGVENKVLSDLRELRQQPRQLTPDEVFSFHARLFKLLSAALDKVKQKWPHALDFK